MSIDNNNSSTSAQHPNKWLKWYYKFCESRKYRGIKKEKGYHVHHIIPVCDDGTDDPENLVKLTHREHFIFHVLLAKGTGDPNHWCYVRRAIYGKGSGKGALCLINPGYPYWYLSYKLSLSPKHQGQLRKGEKSPKK